VIVEQISKIVKIKSVDGNLWAFNMDEIDKILKEDAPIVKEKVFVAPDSLTHVRFIVTKRDTVVVEKKKEEVVQKTNIAKKAQASATTTPKMLADRDPVLACAFSIIVPGLGQIYNGELGKGIAFMGTTLIPLVISAQAKETNAKLSSAFGYIALASYICNVIEAPFRTTTLNSRRAILRRKYKRTSFLMAPNVNYLYATNGKYIPETGHAGVKITFQFDGK
jgi:TM2 domain.